jgi:hypothetical protein
VEEKLTMGKERKVMSEKIWEEMNDSGGNIYFRFASGAKGYSGANVQYILREGALENIEGLYLQNYERIISQGGKAENIEYIKQILIMVNQMWEEMSLRRIDWNVRAATYHWMVMSFLRRVPTKQVRDMASKYLREVFPDAKAIAAVHQNTQHTHVHVHLVNRTKEGMPERITYNKWRQLDEYWGAIFGGCFGEGKLDIHLEKKKQTKEYKRARYEGRELKKPERYCDGKTVGQRWQERIEQAMRGIEDDESSVNRNQQSITRESERIEQAKGIFGRNNRANEKGTRGIFEIDETLQRADRITEQSHRTVQQTLATGIRVVELCRGEAEIERELSERSLGCDGVVERDDKWDWER